VLSRFALAVVAVFLSGAAAPDRGEALRDAAQAGSVDEVRTLLEAGVPADAPARHGQTALLFAAGKGRLDVVRLLLERGANVNARERFFGATPLASALDGRHRDVALLLLARGATDAAAALDSAIENDDLVLARAALATGLLEPLELKAALKQAAAKPEMHALLSSARPNTARRPPYAVSPERLRTYAGRYRREAGDEAVVTIREGRLAVATGARPELILTVIAEDRFESSSGDVEARFGGRGGTVEWLSLNRDGDVSGYSVVTADPAPLKAATRPSLEGGGPRAEARPWPQFRGPAASGIGDGQGAPAVWEVAKGTNVRFKTKLPGLALSSPIVWGDRIYVTTAVGEAREQTFRTGLYGDPTSVDDVSRHSFRLFAIDATTGRVAWEREVHAGAPSVRRHLKSSLANASPVTDGRRVVVLFGSVGVLAAYDVEGRPLWRREIGVLDCNDPQAGTAEWGHASSPILYDDLVIVQGDRRRDSFLAAFRIVDGQEAWRVRRQEPSTWATPNVLRAPSGDELLTNGQTIRAYDPRNGRALWTLGPNSEVVVATPVVADGMAFITAGYPPVRPVYAVRAGQSGDLSLPEGQRHSPAVAWSHARGGTYIPTPLHYRGHLYTVNNNGILTCYRADTGEQVYQTRLGAAGASFAASPVAADGRIYFAAETGEVYVLRAGPDYELLATNPMDEVVMATPAISNGLMVVRTLGHVVGLADGR
jgi:outer membrane protein assembly factor BamB